MRNSEDEPLATALDALYAVEPTEFVATRKRLAAELRAAGEPGAAKVLRAAHRPTTAAWALNQLSRREPGLVDAFLELSRELQAVQAGTRSGGRDAVREATRAQREALATTADAALGLLGTRASDTYRSQILATLHAATTNPDVGEQLEQGRLIREMSGAIGFPEGPDLTLVPDLEPSAAPEEAERAEEAERRRAEALAAAQAAREEADVATAAAAAAHGRVDRLERDLEDARRDAREADNRAHVAERDAAWLARAAKELET